MMWKLIKFQGIKLPVQPYRIFRLTRGRRIENSDKTYKEPIIKGNLQGVFSIFDEKERVAYPSIAVFSEGGIPYFTGDKTFPIGKQPFTPLGQKKGGAD